MDAPAKGGSFLVINRAKTCVASFNLHSPALPYPIPKKLLNGYYYLAETITEEIGLKRGANVVTNMHPLMAKSTFIPGLMS